MALQTCKLRTGLRATRMVLPISALLLAAALLYALFIGGCAAGFRRVLRRSSARHVSPLSLPTVSVVIAARNEEASIGACLTSVLNSDYPEDRFEVIVVDDGSEDGTAAVVRRLQRRFCRVAAGSALEEGTSRLRLVRTSGMAGHKQAALRRGIARARGNLILTTDADCTVGPRWIQAMASAFTPETALVAGTVRYRPQTRFGRLQALEFLGLVALGAGTLGLGWPTLCNSANVAYRREVYERLRPSEPNGARPVAEDELLLHRAARTPGWTVRFCADEAAVVDTSPMPDLSSFLAQRQRWASMAPHYPSPLLVAASGGIYLFYVLLLIAAGLAWTSSVVAASLLAALGLKTASEAALLYPACRHFRQLPLFRYFLPAQLLQIPYVVYAGAASLLGEVHWKGRPVG